MTLDEALTAADEAKAEDLCGQYQMAAQVLAAEVLRLREENVHLSMLALQKRRQQASPSTQRPEAR